MACWLDVHKGLSPRKILLQTNLEAGRGGGGGGEGEGGKEGVNITYINFAAL